MPYDSSLDEQVYSKEFETENGKIVVSVHSYNKGQKKVQVIREVKNRDGEFNFAKLGRLSKEELEGVLPLLQEASKLM